MLVVMVVLGGVVGVCVGSGYSADDETACAEVTHETLECGLEVVVYAQEGMVGETQVWVRLHQGAMYEADEERGASVMAARAAAFGVGGVTQDRMLELLGVEIEQVLSGSGVQVRGSHVEFPFRVGVETDDELMESALRVGRGLVEGFAPSDEMIEQTRRGMLEELERIETEEIDRALARVWLPDLVDGSAYGRLPLPERGVIERMNGDAVRAFVRRAWTPDQASILVVGNVDGAEIVAQARRVFDGCGSGDGDEVAFPEVFKDGLDGRIVSLSDERVELSRIGLVWFGETHEPRWDEKGVEEMLVMALVAESMRHRVSLMLRAEFESVEQVRVDAGDLLGRARYGQIVAVFENQSEAEGGRGWDSVIGAMERERVRLVRDGLSDREIERAREWLIQQWGYEVDQWEGSTSDELARSLSWMMAMGRPLVDLAEWVEWAQGLLDGVDGDRVHGVIREMFSEEPAVLVLTDGERAAGEDEIRAVLDEARRDELPAIGGGWIDELSGPILERSNRTAARSGYGEGSRERVDEISVHPQSGVVTARLTNGVVVRHREMKDPEFPGRVVMVVRVGFGSIEDASMNGAGDVVVEAMNRGAIRSRTERELRGIQVEHDLAMSVELGAWGIELEVSGPVESYQRVAELAHAMLTDLRIEGELIDEIQAQAFSGERRIGAPIDDVEVGIARAFGVRFDARRSDVFGEGVDARSVREWMSERVRGDAIEIGIAGGIDAEIAIEACASEFGWIPAGGESDPARLVEQIEIGVEGEETVRVAADDGMSGVMVGFGACEVGDIEELRTLTVAGMVLDGRLQELARGLDQEVEVMSGAMTLDLLPGRVVMFTRVVCDEEDIEDWTALLEDELERMAYGGVEVWEAEEPRDRISEALGKWVTGTGFWATRLAQLGERGGDVDALWSMRDSYSVIGATDIEGVFGKWYRDGKHFRIEMVHEER